MKKNSFKKLVGLFTIVSLFFGISAVFASQNIISSVIISKAKDGSGNYELNIDSSEPVNYKANVEKDSSIYFDLKNSILAPKAGVVYEDVSNIDNVVVKQLDNNKVRIYVQGKNAKNTELVFINSLFDTTKESSRKNVIINKPINEYKSTNYNVDLEDQNDIQAWDDNSFNLSHLGISVLSELKEGSGGIILIFLSLFTIIAIIAKTITKKLSMDREPLIGLNNSSYFANDLPEAFNKKMAQSKAMQQDILTNRAKTLQNAQAELAKAHQRYQDYLQNKYNSYKPKSVNVDAVKKGIALNQYQKSNQNPYINQEVVKIKKDSIQIPPRPRIMPAQKSTNPYTQNKPTKQNGKNPNMKFLESVTKIYEQSGRGDLADGLKNSIIKAKQIDLI